VSNKYKGGSGSKTNSIILFVRYYQSIYNITLHNSIGAHGIHIRCFDSILDDTHITCLCLCDTMIDTKEMIEIS
jgi:hypothetical protein